MGDQVALPLEGLAAVDALVDLQVARMRCGGAALGLVQQPGTQLGVVLQPMATREAGKAEEPATRRREGTN